MPTKHGSFRLFMIGDFYDTSTFHLSRQNCENAVKSVLYGAKGGQIFALVVVGDYGNTTNGKMKNRKCG